jgi:hypothetical protein
LGIRINLEPTQKVFNALEDVDKGIVAFPHVLGRLDDADIIQVRASGGEGKNSTHREEDGNTRKNKVRRRERLGVSVEVVRWQ